MPLSATNLLSCCGINPCNECMYAHNPLKVQSSHVMSAVANRQKKACDSGGGNAAMWEKKMLLLMELCSLPNGLTLMVLTPDSGYETPTNKQKHKERDLRERERERTNC